MVEGREERGRQKKRQKKGKGEWAWMEHAGGSFVRASSAGRPSLLVAPGATTLRIRPRVWTFRSRLPAGVHTFLRAGHTRARARDFMKTIVSAATARNDDVRSDVNSRGLRSTNLKGIIFHATSHTRAHAYNTGWSHTPGRSLAPDELGGEQRFYRFALKEESGPVFVIVRLRRRSLDT